MNSKNNAPRVMVVLLEYNQAKQHVFVRGCWPREEYDYQKYSPLETQNIQHAVKVFEGIDHKNGVGFEGLVPGTTEEEYHSQKETERGA